ncbi:hypothetical protein ACEPAF_7350 [Sanghuangporus sanghuang]
MESPARRRVEVPRASADAGLAEWTSKIKAIQRDVDADEELEQRRLEEEIRASRLARTRRSAQFAGRMSLGTFGEDENIKGSTPADALRKLSGEPAAVRTSPPPAAIPVERKPSTSPNSNSNSNSNSNPEPISLAAFIGGRATGPRLNKPAPQPDAHDPTQFEQRSRADIVAPHPVFGSGGVALVGLAGKGREIVETRRDAKTPERYVSMPVREEVKPATSGITAAKGVPTANVGSAAQAPARSWVRSRTVSSPSPYMPPKPVKSSPPPVIPAGSPGVKGRVESLYAHANRSTERVTSPPLLRGSKSTDKMGQRPAAPAKPDALRKSQAATVEINTPPRSSTSPFSISTTSPPSPRMQTPTSATPTKPASTSPPVTTPSLARPLQPQSRPVSNGPQILQSRNPAPAFLKPHQQKDLTPSLSRLQGRGFVQSFVKRSSEIEAAAGNNGGSPERLTATATPSPKRVPVLERWNPSSPSPSPSSGSPISAPPLRKAKTFDFPGRTAESTATPAPAPEPVRPAPQPKPASLAAGPAKSTPTKAKSAPVPAPGDVLPLGSSNTLISYIKPTKTGDTPPTDSAEVPRSKTPSRHVDEKLHADELGVRPKSRSSNTRSLSPSKKAGTAARPSAGGQFDLASSVPSSGRPLSHPTKDRAKLRRKGGGSQTQSKMDDQEAVESPVDGSVARESGVTEPATTKGATAPVLNVTRAVSKSGAPSSSGAIHWQRDEQSKTPSVQAHGENMRLLQDTWSNQGPIGVKPLHKPPIASPSPTRSSFSASASQVHSKTGVKQALPSLAVSTQASGQTGAVPPPSPPLTPPLSVGARQERVKPPSSPAKHGRIPSTGSRATVMDVAQALNASVAAGSPVSPVASKPPRSPFAPPTAEENDRQRDPGGWNEAENERTITPAIIKAERRRSTYERYSNFTLPALPEEKTPVSSPVGTLKKGADIPVPDDGAGAEEDSGKDTQSGGIETRVEKPAPPKKPDFARAPSSKIHIDVVDEPVPAVNAAKVWETRPPGFVPDPDQHTVSVEVLDVAGGSSTEITKGPDNVYVFYETELLAIVHRAKSRSSGLVATKVWAWTGRKAEGGEREEKKLQELAKRYGTALLRCGQCAEPQELVNVLGGILVIRQGQRSLWSSENTTMHVVRSSAGVILIDEVDLNVRNLCSGFSYCISLLDTLWVWYGCGSIPAERNAALRYAQTLYSGNDEKKLVEVEEGNEDEMFWMFLGEDGYASADYWKWRKNEKGVGPRFWRVDCVNTGSEVKELETFPSPSEVSGSVLVVHLAYEIFTLIGSEARGQRRNIKLGLTLAEELSSHTARSKPFRPPVHVLIFPSQVPLDLQAAIRGLDLEAIYTATELPNHMNLLTLSDAWKQLRQRDWDEKELEDRSMMPLGLMPR